MTADLMSCDGVALEDLHACMEGAFADYLVPLSLTLPQFRFMLTQRGFVPALSWVARDAGRPVAFWLVAAEGEAAYVISAGTLPSHRGRGLARRLFGPLAARLAERGIRALRLEVIRDNLPARRHYDALEFRTTRGLDCYELDRASAAALADRGIELRRLPGPPAAAEARRDWPPTWQNDDQAVARIADDCLALGASAGGQGLGYGVVIRPTACVAQLAVGREVRRQGVGRAILAGLARACEAETLHLLNLDERDTTFRGFLEALGASASIGQVEMVLDLHRAT